MKPARILTAAFATAVLTLSLSGCYHRHDVYGPPPPPGDFHHDDDHHDGPPPPPPPR